VTEERHIDCRAEQIEYPPRHRQVSGASGEWLERSPCWPNPAPCATKDKGAALSRKTLMRRFRKSRSP
jgi:hypothetical protein